MKNRSEAWVEKEASSRETKSRDMQSSAEQLCRYLCLMNSTQRFPLECLEWSRRMSREAEAANWLVSYCSIYSQIPGQAPVRRARST